MMTRICVVGLALVLLAYGASGIDDVRNVKLLALGAVAMALGFALASLDLHESDPGVAIVLVPIGALVVVRALYVAARTAWRL